MAVYAAMIDRMDRGIGQVIDKIKELGKEENTIICFLSDNGGCGQHIDNTPDSAPGPVDTYSTVDAPWGNMSNTPFRKFKVFDHEGGISTPFIMSWPRFIKRHGSVTHRIGHVIDFLPTFIELAGVSYPETFKGKPILPINGKGS